MNKEQEGKVIDLQEAIKEREGESRFTHAIIAITLNQLEYTIQCFNLLLETMPDKSILVVVDNGSKDGTSEWLVAFARRAEEAGLSFAFLESGGNVGFARAMNLGLDHVLSEGGAAFYTFLNNDTLPPADWIEGLESAFERASDILEDPNMRVGIVGPVSNNVGGPQLLKGLNIDPRRAQETAEKCAEVNADFLQETFFLSGFCQMVSNECLQAILMDPHPEREVDGVRQFYDERFFIGFEDNDACLRAQAAGFRLIINPEVFLYHYGHVTLDVESPWMRRGLAERSSFTRKWREIREKETRLIAMVRTKNGASGILEQVLDNTGKFADGIVVVSDGSTDETVMLCECHPDVLEVRHYERDFDERRDRNELIDMAEAYGADWILSVDDDEIFCMSRKRVERLMLAPDPHQKQFCFKWYTFWDDKHYRDDGIFGDMNGFRLCKLEKGRRIFAGNKIGLHCGNIPLWPEGNSGLTNIRVKHYGYDEPAKREKKFNFYSAIDTDVRPELVGSATYHHVKDEDVTLLPWTEEDGVTLNVITHNDEEGIEAFLQFWYTFVDEVVIVDTGSKDNTAQLDKFYADKFIYHPMNEGNFDLSRVRNMAIKESTRKWILVMDPDEKVDASTLWRLRRMMNDPDTLGWLFQFANHQTGGEVAHSESCRLFLNREDIFFTRPVHETIERCFRNIPGARLKAAVDFHVDHYGFMQDEAAMQAKINLYRNVYLRYMKKNRDDPQPYYNEAMHWWNLGNIDKCEKWLARAIKKEREFYSARMQLALLYQSRAAAQWDAILAIIKNPGHPMRHLAERNKAALEGITPPPIHVGAEARSKAAKRLASTNGEAKESDA